MNIIGYLAIFLASALGIALIVRILTIRRPYFRRRFHDEKTTQWRKYEDILNCPMPTGIDGDSASKQYQDEINNVY